MKKSIYTLIFTIILVLPVLALAQNTGQRICTQEAKLCSDGSYVGRTGPYCEFAPCPGGQASSTPSRGDSSGIVTLEPAQVCAGENCPVPKGYIISKTQLVADSKRALVNSGLTSGYVNKHFILIKVNAWAVKWKFSVGGYSANVTDRISYQKSKGAIHSSGTDAVRHDINKVIPIAKAVNLLKSCAGSTAKSTVNYDILDKGTGKAAFYLAANPDSGKGYVNLENGQCVKRQNKFTQKCPAGYIQYGVPLGCISQEKWQYCKTHSCPICLSAMTRIDTPDGAAAVKDIKIGGRVWTMDKNGKKVIGRIIEVRKKSVSDNAKIIRLTLNDGRSIEVSPLHPTADKRLIWQLKIGDNLDNSTIKKIEWIFYKGDTYDLLPSGDTGFYWANRVLLGSTLRK